MYSDIGSLGLKVALESNLIERVEAKMQRNTDRIMEFIKSQSDFVTLKQIHEATELPMHILSGTLVSLCKSGKLHREKIERQSGTGPKKPWGYKIIVAN